MNFFQSRNTSSNSGSTFFGGSNGNRPSFFNQRSDTNQTQQSNDSNGFFNRNRVGGGNGTPSFMGQGNTNSGSMNSGQGSFFNRNQQNSNSQGGSYQNYNRYGSDSNQTVGTFTVRYKETQSSHRECVGNYVCCITSMREYENQKASIFRKRCEDYMLLKSGNVPNDNFVLGILKNYAMNGHINPSIVDPRLVEAVKNATQQQNTNKRHNEGFQTANSYFNSGNRDNQSGGSNTNAFFGRGGNNTNSTQGSSYFNSGGNQAWNQGGGNGNSGNSGGGFFNRGNQGNSNANQGNSNGNQGGFFSQQSGGQSGASFFNRGNQGSQGSQGGQGNQGGSNTSFFNQNQSNTNQGNTNTGFFNSSNTNRSFFSGSNTNQGNSSFFNNNANQNNSNTNTASFFQSQRSGQNSFFNQNQGQNSQSNGFFRNQNSNTQGFFQNQQSGGNSNFSRPNQQGNSFFQPQNNSGGQPDNNLFGVPNNANPYPAPYGMMPMYGPYPNPAFPYGQMMPPYGPNMFYPVPITMAQDPNSKIPNSKAFSTWMGMKDLYPILDQDQLEKNIEKGTAEELKKQVQEMERQNYIMERYINAIKDEHEDYTTEPSVKSYTIPNIVKKPKELKQSANQSIVRSKGHSSVNFQSESRSFLTGKSSHAFAKDTITINEFQKDVEKDKYNKIITLKIVAAYDDYPTFIEDLKINKFKTIKDLKNFLLSKIPKFSYSVDDILYNSEILVEDSVCSDTTRLKDIPDIEEKELFMKIALKSNINSINDRLSKSLKNSPFTPKKNMSFKADEHIEKVLPAKELCQLKNLPILTKVGYTLKPSLIQMSRMTNEELQNIEDLTISNEFGEILWPGKTDVTGVNFDLWVMIKKDSVEVYPDDLFDELTKPDRGTKLNKPAEITLRNFFPKNEKMRVSFKEKLEQMCENQDAKFLNYDEENGVWRFKVFHFTIYSFVNIDEEDELETNQQEHHPSNRILTSDLDFRSDGHIGHKSDFIREEKQTGNVFSDQHQANQNDLANPNRMLDKDRKTLHRSKDMVDRSHPNYKNKKINTSQSFRYLLKDSYQDQFIPEASDDQEIDIEREYQEHQQQIQKDEKFTNYLQEEVQKKIRATNALYNEYKEKNTSLSKEVKLKKYKQIDTEILNQVTLLNRFNGRDALWRSPEDTSSKPEFYNDFNFGAGWIGNGLPYKIDQRNHFKSSREQLSAYFKTENEFLQVLQESFDTRLLKTISIHTPDFSKDSDSFFVFLLNLYNVLKSNQAALTSSICKDSLSIIKLIAELFLLSEVKFDTSVSAQNLSAEVKAQIEARDRLFREEIELFNHTIRRKLLIWIEKLFIENSKSGAKSFSGVRNINFGDSFGSLMANKFDTENFSNVSERILRNQDHFSEHYSQIWAFYQLMLKEEHQSKSVDELVTLFTATPKGTNVKPLDIIFVNILKTYSGLYKFQHKDTDQFAIVDLLKEFPQIKNEYRLLNLFVLMALQSVYRYSNFDFVFKPTYTLCQEILLQNNEYYSALALHFLAKAYLNHLSHEEEAYKIVTLHFITSYNKDKYKRNQQNLDKICKGSQILNLKILKYIIQGDVRRIIENVNEIQMGHLSYEFLLKEINESVLEQCLTESSVRDDLISLFVLAQTQEPISVSTISSIVYEYLLFIRDASSDNMTEENLDHYIEEVFGRINVLNQQNQLANYKKLIEVIVEGLTIIMTNVNFGFNEYIRNKFVPKVLDGKYLLIVGESNRSALLAKWFNKFN